MATLNINLPVDSGAFLHRIGRQLIDLSYSMPDQTPTGATNVLTIDTAPGGGNQITLQVTSGAYQTGKKHA
jgi:hypothetical protein